MALTGTEAIATGVPAFKPPESRNAARTLIVMAVLLAVLFVGITFLATHFGIAPVEGPSGKTVIGAGRRARVYGVRHDPLLPVPAFTALILFLAANTSFNAFPRLAAILAQDGFMPRQFAFRGDRLAFTSGIVVLGVVAASLVVVFGGETHLLIPLYAVGVFIDFTISQSGMVRHWLRSGRAATATGWPSTPSGCVVTGTVAVVVTVAKAPDVARRHRAHPHPGGDDAASSTASTRRRPGSWRCGRTWSFGPPHRRERVIIPVPNMSRAGRPGGQGRRARSPTTCGSST